MNILIKFLLMLI